MKKEVKIAIFLMLIVCFSFLPSSKIVYAQVDDEIPPMNGNESKSGVLDHYIFSRSIPKQMIIGEPYTSFVSVKNIGKDPAKFRVLLITPSEFIYPPFSFETFDLDKGEYRRIKFLITPTKPHIGELNIMTKLFLVDQAYSYPGFILLDSASSSVIVIKKAFSTGDIIMAVALSILIISGSAIVIKKLKY